jgi:FtsZ-binding cell division protein ZapB
MRRYHKDVESVNISITNNNLLCKYCEKSFSSPQNRWRHENKVCKEQNKITDNKYEIEELKEKNKQLEQMIIELSNKIDSKNTTNNNTINNNSNNTQNIQNNITINKFGNESIYILEENDVKKIINDDKKSIANLVEVINFNEKYPEIIIFVIHH